MTTSELVFDPFSKDFFEEPQAIYRRMREEAPVYYNQEYDFYALTRHEDVAAAFKDFETYTSSRGVDLQAVKSGEPPPMSIIMMDPPDHRRMRSLVNKVFTPRAMHVQREMVTEQIDRFLGAVDSDEFDVVQDFAALFPIEFIAQMLGVPPKRTPADKALGRHHPGARDRLHGSARVCRMRPRLRLECSTTTSSKSGVPICGTTCISDLIGAKVERETGAQHSSTISRSPALQHCWAAPAQRPLQSWSAPR